MKKIMLTTTLCCLLAGNVFAAVEWNVESGVWSDGANWSGGAKPTGSTDIGLRRSATSVCTLDTDEGLINNRMVVQNGQTFNIVNGGRVGTTWTRFGRTTTAYVNLSGNGTYIMYNENAQIGVDGGYCKWTMSDTSSLLTNSATKGIVGLGEKSSTGWLKLVGSSVTVNVNQISITSSQGVNTATLEYVMDAGGASTIMTGSVGIAGFGNAYLVLSATTTLAEQDIVLIQNSGANPVAGAGAFTAMNGGSAAEGTPIILGGNVYSLTYKYAANGTAQNDVALVFVRSARHMTRTPVPANQTVMLSSPSTLSWTNPDPNIPGNSITCKVYFGMDPNRLNMDTVTLAPNASTVAINATNFPTYGAQPLTNKSTYYWVVDCTDPSANPADGLGLFWKFSTDFNNAPTVDAGSNQVVWLGKSGIPGQEMVSLVGAISDDGLPKPPGAYTVKWTQVSGPAVVTPSPDNTVSTNVTITVTGTYVFQLTADDTDKQASDTVQVIVGTNSCHASFLNGTNYNSKDFNTDCVVNLADLADFVAAWLACTNTQEGCI
jgi:hypothetical protein